MPGTLLVIFTIGQSGTVRSRARVCGRPIAGTAGLSPTQVMDVRLLRLLFVV